MTETTERRSLFTSTAFPSPGSAVNELAVRERSASLVQQHQAAHQVASRTEQARAELANVQALCRRNRQADTCPHECVVSQWRRRTALLKLDRIAAFRRNVSGAE